MAGSARPETGTHRLLVDKSIGTLESMDGCQHIAEIGPITPSAAGCEDCLRTGDWWVHLRLCQTCGHVGCCDESPNKHATAHFQTTGHPVIRSFEPDESWLWCFVDEVGVEA